MARTRVHELAKELNVGNKDLIERILRLGIQVKNHMSTLSDVAVQKIREHLDTTRAQVVEEKRIGRTVIRRRKTQAEPISEAAPAAAGLVESSEPSPVLEVIPEMAVDIVSEMIIRAPTVPKPVKPATEAPPVSAAPLAAPSEAPASVPQTPSSAPHPMERLPLEVPEAEPARPPLEVAATPEKEDASLKTAALKVEVVQPAPEIEPAIPPVVRGVEEFEAAQEITEPVTEEDAEGTLKKAKKRRRKKARKEEPARIIKLPDLISEEPEPEEEVELPPVVSRLVTTPPEEEAKEQLRKRKVKLGDLEEKVPERKKVGVSRKEVIEREDLYSKKELAAQADRERGKAKGRVAPLKEVRKPEITVPKAIKRRIRIDEAITVANLARQMGIKAGELIKKLLLLGLPASINQAIDFDTAAILCADYEFEAEKSGFEEEGILQFQPDRVEDLKLRPPVITVMGHVDHGKTSLLDAIRHTNVIGGEAGGITQHIGAYDVQLKDGHVVFLDTPGHEAFTSMRARGAKVTDIVILVVAADDGVMQQTVEAINHAKAAGVPIMVAINKVDKPNANVERVKRELAEHGLVHEEWGGDVTMVEVSAKKRQGIEELLEMVLLQAELLELKSNPDKMARGHVIEAKLDKGRGPVATILIQDGTLKAGDAYVCGVHSGRVRNMFNDRGQRIEDAPPSTPVEVLGFSGVPNAGDDFIVLTDERQAKLVAENRLLRHRERALTRSTKVTLESLYEQIREGGIKELNVILRTDVQGSLEAISDSLTKLSSPDVKVGVLHSATGAISETDILLASASNAIVIGFNVRADSKVQELATHENVDIRYYDVIYQIINDVKDAMVGMLEPVYEENVLGRAEVRQTFHVPKIGTVAGCYVLDGHIERGAKVRVLRDQVVVYDGKMASLRRFKDDVKEVRAGFECGLGIENFNDIKVNDILEVYELKEVKPELQSGDANRT
jgi:translation initiation factor IF-2